MPTRREVQEMRELVERAQKGIASREDWSNLAALTLMCQGKDTVSAMAAGGYEMFQRTCRSNYECHHFQDPDFHRMYARVCAAAARFERGLVH